MLQMISILVTYLPVHLVKGEISTTNLSKQSLMVSILKRWVTCHKVNEGTDQLCMRMEVGQIACGRSCATQTRTAEQHVQKTSDGPHIGHFIVVAIGHEYFRGDKGGLANDKM